MADGTGAHLALRPGWDCADCAQPWPCPARRAMLLAERPFDRLMLLMFLSASMHEAIDDFYRYGIKQVPDLYHRFLGWARQVEPDAPSETADVVSLPP
jgi:hypothetical protein